MEAKELDLNSLKKTALSLIEYLCDNYYFNVVSTITSISVEQLEELKESN